MSPQNRSAIQLAPERHAQLKAIGAALGGLTITETIAHMINSEIEKGTIPAGFEGVNVFAADGGLKIGFDDLPPVFFSKEAVADLIAILRDFSEPGKGATILVNMQHDFKIERRGTGLKVAIPFGARNAKSFSRDLARDLANLLEHEIAGSKAA